MKPKPELDIHVDEASVLLLEESMINRLTTVTNALQKNLDDVERPGVKDYHGDISLLDECIRLILDIFKDFFRRSGYLDDGTVTKYPIRLYTLDTLKTWAPHLRLLHPNFKTSLYVIIDRLEDTCNVVEEYADLSTPAVRRESLRTELRARRFL
jgi:hypothetical protein